MRTQQLVMGPGRHARQECGQDALEKKVREVRTEVVAGNLVRIGYLRSVTLESLAHRNLHAEIKEAFLILDLNEVRWASKERKNSVRRRK